MSRDLYIAAVCLMVKIPTAPRKFHQPVPVQAGHFKIELVPGEFRVASHQGFKVTFRRTSEKSRMRSVIGFSSDIKLPSSR